MNPREADQEAAGGLARLGNPKTVILETRKRDGTWVATPLSLVLDGDHAYFRTYDASGKYKRLRNYPEIRLTPSKGWTTIHYEVTAG